MTFGRRIKQAREALGIRQRAMADSLKISPSYLSRIERGREPPPDPRIIRKLVRLLNCDPDELYSLAKTVDPELLAFVRTPQVLAFLRKAKQRDLSRQQWNALGEELENGTLK